MDAPDSPTADSELARYCYGLKSTFIPALLGWYADSARCLPWRQDPTPYHTWVSEVMLQQTQVSTVIPYYLRFLDRYPDVFALATAELPDVLALWQGLGYYSRARSLHAAARQIVEHHNGVLPAQHASLLALPGIGEYTAGAILSIAFHQDCVALDGNVKRVLARLLDYGRDIAAPSGKEELAACANVLLPRGQAGAFNQAMMDLGATLCSPRHPRCASCPLASQCLSLARDTVTMRPVRKGRPRSPLHEMVGGFVHRGDLWLAVHRPPRGLLGGLWEVPGFELRKGPGDDPFSALQRGLDQSLHLRVHLSGPPSRISHAYTHMKIALTAYSCLPDTDATLQPGAPWDDLRWLNDEQMPAFGITGLSLKVLKAMHATQLSLL